MDHSSWCSRISGSFKGMALGLTFGVVGIAILCWNEGNSVHQHQALKEGLKSVVDVPSMAIDPSNEGKLIHLIGYAEASNDNVTDPVFGVMDSEALKLKRKVEMYQWVEKKATKTKKNAGGSSTSNTTYSYDKEWKSELVSSSTFHNTSHKNPTSMRYQQTVIEAENIIVGAFALSKAVTDLMNWYNPIDYTPEVDDIIDNTTRDEAKSYGNNGFFFGSNSTNPAIGDTRVSFDFVSEQTVSIVARQTKNNSLSTYTTKSGASILLVEAGSKLAAEMFQQANQVLATQTWLLRAMGFTFVFVMFKLLAEPLEAFADIIPFLGDLVGTASTLIALVAATIVSLVVIALAWLLFRPFLSIFILCVAVGLGCVVNNRERIDISQGVYSLLSND